jgi:hypothetical protein
MDNIDKIFPALSKSWLALLGITSVDLDTPILLVSIDFANESTFSISSDSEEYTFGTTAPFDLQHNLEGMVK